MNDKLKPNIYKTYRNAIEEHANPVFDHLNLRNIRPISYQKFIDYIIEKALAKSTAHHVPQNTEKALKLVASTPFS